MSMVFLLRLVRTLADSQAPTDRKVSARYGSVLFVLLARQTYGMD